MSPYHLTNFEMQIYYLHESQFNGVYSRDHLLENVKGVHLIFFMNAATSLVTGLLFMLKMIN